MKKSELKDVIKKCLNEDIESDIYDLIRRLEEIKSSKYSDGKIKKHIDIIIGLLNYKVKK